MSDTVTRAGQPRERLLPEPFDSGRGWVIALVTGLVTAVAALWRLVELSRPARIVFDETYYVKQAYSLLHLGYEGVWGEGADVNFAAGVFTDLGPAADYVVHPPVGKWMIAAGMAFFDPADPVGWRISAAVAGTLSVLLVVLIARRLFGHIAFGAAAGLLLAVDGVHLVMSRTGILDIFLSFWVLAAFGALLLDRDAHRRRLARGQRTWWRGWLVVAGVCLGLATGVKWSGAYFLAVFGLVSVAWSIGARHRVGARRWFGAGVWRDGVPSFLALVPTAALTYLATWLPWLTTPGSYMRGAGANPLASLAKYHVTMWQFHTALSSEHTYQANPLGWLLQLRPTSFAWQQVEGTAAEHLCQAEHCAAAIVAVGNPIVWWGGAIALIAVVIGARRDWRAWAILAGYLGGWVPWFLYPERTVFTFYTVAFAPFVVLALMYGIARLCRTRRGVYVGAGVVIAALLFGVYFWSVWTSKWVPYWFWQGHMFLPSWI